MVDSLKIGLECLIVGKLGLGLEDIEVRIDDGFVGGLELLLGIGDTGDGSVIGGLGVVDRLLGTGEALEGLVCGGKLVLGGLGLRLCVGQGLRLGGNCLLGARKSGRGVHICGLSLVNASLAVSSAFLASSSVPCLFARSVLAASHLAARSLTEAVALSYASLA